MGEPVEFQERKEQIRRERELRYLNSMETFENLIVFINKLPKSLGKTTLLLYFEKRIEAVGGDGSMLDLCLSKETAHELNKIMQKKYGDKANKNKA